MEEEPVLAVSGSVSRHEAASHIGQGAGAVVIREAVVPADLAHYQSISLHGSTGLVRKTAGLGIAALLADAAAARTEAQGSGHKLSNLFREIVEML